MNYWSAGRLLAATVALCIAATCPTAGAGLSGQDRSKSQALEHEALITLIRDKDIAKSRLALESAARQDPSSFSIRYNLGILAARQELWQDAIEAFGKAESLATRKADASAASRSRDAAMRCMEMDRTPEGRQRRLYRAAVARAGVLLQAGLSNEAISSADAALPLSVSPWEAYLIAGMALLVRGRYTEGNARLTESARLSPDDSRSRIQTAVQQSSRLETAAKSLGDLTRKSISALQSGESGEARRTLNEAAGLIPGSLASASLAAIGAALDGDRSRVDKILNPFLTSYDRETAHRAREVLATLRVAMAIARTELLSSSGPLQKLPGGNSPRRVGMTQEQDAAILVAKDFLAANLLPEAEAALIVALKGESPLAEPHSLLAVVQARRGRSEEAVKHAVAAVQSAPTDAVCREILGQVMQVRRKWDQAIEAHAEAIKLSPTSPGYRNSLGMAYFGAGQFSKAEASFREAARLRPADSVFHANLARSLAKQNKWRDADGAFKKACELAPDAGWLRAEMAECALAQGKTDQARKLADEAARLGLAGSSELAALKTRIGN